MYQNVSQAELEAARQYQALFVPSLFGPWVDEVTRLARIPAGAKVLDVACGTGVLARKLVDDAGSRPVVSGLDPSRAMLTVANQLEPRIEWAVGAAEKLPFEDESFDSVVSQFGMMFFDDRCLATREMWRVLKIAGRLTICVWSGLEENIVYEALADFLARHVSQAAADAVRLPFSLGNPQKLEDLLLDAGFRNVRYSRQTTAADFPSLAELVEAELRGWLPLFGILVSDDEIERLLRIAPGELPKSNNGEHSYRFQTSALLFSANK